jgi:hypothetical protein
MKSNPAMPRGSLMSKPTWPNTSGCSATSAFFVFGNYGVAQVVNGIEVD